MRRKDIIEKLQPENMVGFYEELLDHIEATKGENIFLTVDRDRVMQRVHALEEKRQSGQPLGALFGIPISIKDNIMTKGMRSTCGSKMLEHYIPPYDATVIERIEAADGVIVGKVNMDEFAMGGSGETSYFGPTKNPLQPDLVPGGSSSGSAASVAAQCCVLSLGSDTGGSVRNPASYCNIVGYMPSYGTISRFGVASMANTLDEVGILGESVEDIIALLDVIGGDDERDMTTRTDRVMVDLTRRTNLQGTKVGIVKGWENLVLTPAVQQDFQQALKELTDLGAELVEIDLPHLRYASALYTLIMSCEVSSNMSRYDGIRYGYRTEQYDETKELYIKTRSEGFGEEVKRRIAMGTHFLSAEYGRKLYDQGLAVRQRLSEDFRCAFKQVDWIATPTTTDLPYEIGLKAKDPLAAFDSGDFNVPVNLCGLCAISLPIRKGISGSLQLIGKRYDDAALLEAAHIYEGRNNHEL